MRSDFDLLGAVARQAADPDNPHRLLAAAELDRLARHHRAMAIGEAIASAIVWIVRLPGRLTTGSRAPGAVAVRSR